MKNKYLILWFTVVCALLLSLFSCEKEFNPREKYKDITIVYCLVNPVDTFHYIRIHKAFLGPENVLVMAENPDSSLYPVEDIDVRIYEVTPIGTRTQLTVDTITIKNKKPGYFYYLEGQRMYRFEKIFEKTTSPFGEDSYKPENSIKIEVEHKKTGKIVYAETSLVNSFNMIAPIRGTALNLKPNITSTNFQWNNAKNGRIYDVYYTLRYREGRYAQPSNEGKKDSLVWHVGSHSAIKTGNGTSQVEKFTYNPGAFYAQVIRDIPYDEGAWRRPYDEVRLAVWCGSEDLYYYNNINAHSQGITQERPEYTNLKTKIYSEELGAYKELENEAFGLFSSRIVRYVSLHLSPEMVMKYLPETDRQFLPIPADKE
jgi:hypothetical protein